MRSLGLDIGDKRIGVAMSDPEGILASPLVVIVRDDDAKAINEILELISKYEVQQLVIGLPYSLDGGIGFQASKIMTFIERLSMCTETNIEVCDERLSTVAAEHLLIEAGVKSRKRKERRDVAAAAFILQGYLDSQRSHD